MEDVLLTSRIGILRLEYGSWLSVLEPGWRCGWHEREHPEPNPEDAESGVEEGNGKIRQTLRL